MNKWIPITTCCLLGATTAVHAQSSVTLSGVMDLSARSSNNSGGTLKSLSSGNNSTSRIWFKGSEDLGGGLRANFWLESSMQIDTGTAGTGSQFWDRQATVSLSGPFGEVRAGRDWTPVYYGFVFADPWINVGVGSASNFLNASVATTYQRAFGSALNPTTLSRSNNAVEYWLPPNLGGLYGNAMVAPGEAANASGGFKYTAGRLGWRGAGADVAVYGGDTRIDVTGSSLKQTGVFASYAFASVTLMTSVTESSYLSSKHQHLLAGVRAYVGPFVLKASYNRLDQKGSDATGASIAANDASQWAIGTDYLLSKRTAIYATAARLSNSGAARFTVPGGAAALVAPGSSSSGYEVGLRHSF